ncbi:MAG: hypothetical protein AAF661_07710 [Pseudomonadota bacterium]
MVLGYLIALSGGVLGGWLVGLVWPRFSLSMAWRSLGGVLGGGAAGLMLAILGAGSLAPGFGPWSWPDLGLIIANLISGGVGGAAVAAPLCAFRDVFRP